jgi:hypothetical protein
MDRRLNVSRHRWHALTASFVAAIALAVAGCGSDATNQAGGSPQTSGTAQIVTGEQVVTSCFQNYFYNGILPKAAAQTNCSACVEQKLRKLGIQRTAGESEIDVLTGIRLSSADISSLQSTCNETDTNEQ